MTEEIKEVVNEVCNDEEIETADINLAAALLVSCEGAYLDREKVNKTDPRHVKVLIVGKGLKLMEREWYARRLSGDLWKFATFLKDVKALIHN